MVVYLKKNISFVHEKVGKICALNLYNNNIVHEMKLKSVHQKYLNLKKKII